MKYLGAIGEVLIILALGIGVGLGLAYGQLHFKWNPQAVQIGLVAVGLAISIWAFYVYAKSIKEFHQSLDDW